MNVKPEINFVAFWSTTNVLTLQLLVYSHNSKGGCKLMFGLVISVPGRMVGWIRSVLLLFSEKGQASSQIIVFSEGILFYLSSSLLFSSPLPPPPSPFRTPPPPSLPFFPSSSLPLYFSPSLPFLLLLYLQTLFLSPSLTSSPSSLRLYYVEKKIPAQ